MKKLSSMLLALALAATACGGSTPEEEGGGGIAALEQDEGKDSKTAPEDGKKASAGAGSPKKPGGRSADADKKQTPGGGGETTQPSGGGGSQPNTGGGGGGTQAAPAPVPVPAGEYAYTTDGQRTISGNTSALPKTTTLRAAAPADGVQRQTRDLRDSEGNGTVTDTDLHYRADGVYLSYVKVTSRFEGGITDVREFKLPQPQLIAPRAGGPGFARSFTMQGSGTTAKVTVQAQRWENVTVGGQQVRALLAVTDIRFSGSLEGYQRSTSWFWPKHLLTLKEQVQTDVRNGPIRLQGDYEAQIQRLP